LISVISGYLVIAYSAGSDMTRSQVTIVNTLYLFISTSTLWALLALADRAATFEDIAYAMTSGPVAELESRGDAAAGMMVAFALAIAASFKFMWDIRHPKRE
jgi:hypothetical protein